MRCEDEPKTPNVRFKIVFTAMVFTEASVTYKRKFPGYLKKSPSETRRARIRQEEEASSRVKVLLRTKENAVKNKNTSEILNASPV